MKKPTSEMIIIGSAQGKSAGSRSKMAGNRRSSTPAGQANNTSLEEPRMLELQNRRYLGKPSRSYQ